MVRADSQAPEANAPFGGAEDNGGIPTPVKNDLACEAVLTPEQAQALAEAEEEAKIVPPLMKPPSLDDVSFWDKYISFGCAFDILWFCIGLPRALQSSELWEPPTEDKIHKLVERFDEVFYSPEYTTEYKEKNDGKPYPHSRLRYMWSLWAGCKIPLLLSAFFSLVRVAGELGTPFLTNYLVTAIKNRDFEGLYYAIAILCCLTIMAFAQQQQLRFGELALNRCRSVTNFVIFRKAMQIRNSVGITSAEIAVISSQDTQRFIDIAPFFQLLWASPLQIAIGGVLLWVFLGYSGLFALAVLCLLYPMIFIIGKLQVLVRRSYNESNSLRILLISEFLQGVNVVKMYGWEHFMRERILKSRNDELRSTRQELLLWAIASTNMICFPTVTIALTFLLYTHVEGRLDAADAFATLSLVSILKFPIMNFGTAFMSMMQLLVGCTRIGEILSLELATDDTTVAEGEGEGKNDGNYPANSLPQQQQGDESHVSVELMNVKKEGASSLLLGASTSAADGGKDAFVKASGISIIDPEPVRGAIALDMTDIYAYWKRPASADSHQQPNSSASAATDKVANEQPTFVLKNVNLRVKIGEVCAVTGVVGSGKSMLCLTALGETHIASGSCAIARHGGSALGPIAYCSQESFLLSGTIRDNILFHEPFDAQRYLEVLEVCCLWPDFDQYEDGEMTVVGERGITLSGGQKARIALARAVYAKNVSLMVIDDPFSALDAGTTKRISSALLSHKHGYLRDRAVLLVTHNRLLVTKYADHVLQMDDGVSRHLKDINEIHEALENNSIVSQNQTASVHNNNNQPSPIRQLSSVVSRANTATMTLSSNVDGSGPHGLAEGLNVTADPDDQQLIDKVSSRLSRRGGGGENQANKDAGDGADVSTPSDEDEEDEKENILRQHIVGDTDPLTAASPASAGAFNAANITKNNNNKNNDSATASESDSRQTTAGAEVIENSNGITPDSTNGVPSADSKQPKHKYLTRAQVRRIEEKRHRLLDTTKNRLVKDENYEPLVSLRTFAKYFKHGYGYFTIALIVFFLGIERVFFISCDYWLSQWTTASQSPNKPDTYLSRTYGFGPAWTTSEAMWYWRVYIVIVVITFFLGFNRLNFLAVIGTRVARNLFKDAFIRMLRCPMVFFDTTPTGRIVNRFSHDTDRVAYPLVIAMNGITATQGWVVSALVVCAVIMPYTLLVSMPGIICIYAMAFMFRSVNSQLQRLDAASRSNLQAHIYESLYGSVVVRAYGKSAEVLGRCSGLADDNTRSLYAVTITQRWVSLRAELCGAIIGGIVGIFLWIVRDSISPGLAGMAISWGINLSRSASFTVQDGVQADARLVSVDRLVEFKEDLREEAPLDKGIKDIHGNIIYGLAPNARKDDDENNYEPAPTVNSPDAVEESAEKVAADQLLSDERASPIVPPNPPAAHEFGPLLEVPQPSSDSWPTEGRILFDKVRMRYRQGMPLVLNGATFEVPPGHRVGVIGRTGSGKSSLVQCLFRLRELEGGAIFIDGLDIATVGLSAVRGSRMSIIPQDPVLFSGTVRTNVDPFSRYTDDEIVEALKAVSLWTRVEREGGLAAPVAERGTNFSVGQKQLVCIARAVLRKPTILVMDEATANVDHETDELIQRKVRELFSKTTIFEIAHRLHTVADSDMIVVMDHGVVGEIGAPEELLANPSSHFSTLVEASGAAVAAELREIVAKTAATRTNKGHFNA